MTGDVRHGPADVGSLQSCDQIGLLQTPASSVDVSQGGETIIWQLQQSEAGSEDGLDIDFKQGQVKYECTAPTEFVLSPVPHPHVKHDDKHRVELITRLSESSTGEAYDNEIWLVASKTEPPSMPSGNKVAAANDTPCWGRNKVVLDPNSPTLRQAGGKQPRPRSAEFRLDFQEQPQKPMSRQSPFRRSHNRSPSDGDKNFFGFLSPRDKGFKEAPTPPSPRSPGLLRRMFNFRRSRSRDKDPLNPVETPDSIEQNNNAGTNLNDNAGYQRFMDPNQNEPPTPPIAIFSSDEDISSAPATPRRINNANENQNDNQKPEKKPEKDSRRARSLSRDREPRKPSPKRLFAWAENFSQWRLGHKSKRTSSEMEESLLEKDGLPPPNPASNKKKPFGKGRHHTVDITDIELSPLTGDSDKKDVNEKESLRTCSHSQKTDGVCMQCLRLDSKYAHIEAKYSKPKDIMNQNSLPNTDLSYSNLNTAVRSIRRGSLEGNSVYTSPQSNVCPIPLSCLPPKPTSLPKTSPHRIPNRQVKLTYRSRSVSPGAHVRNQNSGSSMRSHIDDRLKAYMNETSSDPKPDEPSCPQFPIAALGLNPSHTMRISQFQRQCSLESYAERTQKSLSLGRQLSVDNYTERIHRTSPLIKQQSIDSSSALKPLPITRQSSADSYTERLQKPSQVSRQPSAESYSDSGDGKRMSTISRDSGIRFYPKDPEAPTMTKSALSSMDSGIQVRDSMQSSLESLKVGSYFLLLVDS